MRMQPLALPLVCQVTPHTLPQMWVTAMSYLSQTHYALKEYDQAEAVYLKIMECYDLEVYAKQLGPDRSHPNVTGTLAGLGQVNLAMRKYTEAASYLERALTITEKGHGRQETEVPLILSQLAEVYRGMGDPRRTKATLERLLATPEPRGGSPLLVARHLQELAHIFIDEGYASKARPLVARALEVMEKHLGRNHPDVATVRHALLELAARADRPRPKCGSCEALWQPHFKKCSNCRHQFYCNVQCQVTDWPKHKALCKVVAQSMPPEEPTGATAAGAPVKLALAATSAMATGANTESAAAASVTSARTKKSARNGKR